MLVVNISWRRKSWIYPRLIQGCPKVTPGELFVNIFVEEKSRIKPGLTQD
jgi:ribosomal protein S19